MIQYRLPIAEFLAGTIVAVCFAIGLIVLNIRAAGRARTLGLLGVTMVLASTILQSLNGSLAGAYGPNSAVYGMGSIVVAVIFAAGLVLVALAVVRARNPSRRGGH